MLCARYGYAVAYFFYLTCGSMATPVVDDSKELKYEEYVIEHEVSTAQARNAVMSIDLRRGKNKCYVGYFKIFDILYTHEKKKKCYHTFLILKLYFRYTYTKKC